MKPVDLNDSVGTLVMSNDSSVRDDERLLPAINSESKPKPRTLIREPLIVRLHRALGPLAGGMILDTADFVTFGPIGFFLGLIVGCSVGWWISSIYGYSTQARMKWAAVAGMYCTVPFTAVLPLATLVSAIGRFRERECQYEDEFGLDEKSAAL